MTAAGAVRMPWIQPLAAWIEAAGSRGGFFIAFHEYRPSLATALADDLCLGFLDFRAEHMRALGWEAGRLPLGCLTEVIGARAASGGVVVHNAEALLAAKPAEDRQAWLAEFERTPWPSLVLLPVVLFQADLPPASPRLYRVDPDDLPSETLLSRLATQ